MGAQQSLPHKPANEGSRVLDQLGGWNRRAIKRGKSLGAKMEWLQASVKETQESVGVMVDNTGGKARIDMQEATVRQLKKVLMSTRHDHAGDPAHPQVRRIERRLKEEEKLLETMIGDAKDDASAKLMRKKSAALPELYDALKGADDAAEAAASGSGNPAKEAVKRVWVHGGRPEFKQVLPPQPMLPSRRASMTTAEPSTARSKASTVTGTGRNSGSTPGFTRRTSMTTPGFERRSSIDSTYSTVSGAGRRSSVSGVPGFQRPPPEPRVINQYDAEFYGMRDSTPDWRVNIARAKYTFRLAFLGYRGFAYRLKLKNRPVAKLQRVPSMGVYVPLVLGKDLTGFAKEQLVLISKSDKASGANAPHFKGDDAMSSISEEHSVKNTKVPTGRPGANDAKRGHSKQPSVADSIQSVVPTATDMEDMEAIEVESVALADFEIPESGMKNLQMMHMYVNRGNTRWTEDREWLGGKAFDLKMFERLGGLELNHYRLEALQLLKEGKVAYQIHDSDVMMALRDGEQLPLWLQEPWAKIVEHLGDTRLPLGDRFEGLTHAGRLMLSLHIALEAIAGAGAVKGMKMVLHIPHAFQDEIVQRFVTDHFYGFSPDNLVFIPQRSVCGYCFDKKSNMYRQVENSLQDHVGSGESMMQLMYFKEGYTVDKTGQKTVIEKSVMDHLKYLGVEWIRSMFIDDVIASHSDSVVDVAAMAMTMKYNATHGTGMVVQVAEVPTIDEARINGNVVISVVDPSAEKPPDSPNSTVSTASKLIKAATADSRYTVQQVMVDDMQSLKWKDRLVDLKHSSDGSMLTSSCRFFTSVYTLDKILATKNLFHVSLALQGPYLYPKLHIADITTHPTANCIAFTSMVPLSRSLLQHKQYAEDLLPRLCQQDKWPVFKRAINKWASKTVTVETRTSNAYKVAPRNYVLVVADNEVSRDAFDFFCGFIGTNMSTQDTLHLMTCAKTDEEKLEGTAVLETFKDDAMNLANIKRDVVMRHNESLVQATEKYLDAKKADLVIIGSNGLLVDKNSKDKGMVLGSVTLAMARQLLYPILIVKPSRACQLLRNMDGTTESIRVMFQADSYAQQTFELMATLMDKRRHDQFFLAKPHGTDQHGGETMSARSTLGYYMELGRDLGFRCNRNPLESYGHVSIPPTAERERCHLVAVHTAKQKSLTDNVRDLAINTGCAVLINKV